MKKQRIIILSLMLGALSLPMMGLQTTVAGEMWSRWTNDNVKAKDASGKYVDKVSKNYFSLERGYFDLQTVFNPNTKARFTVDMFSTDATHQNSTDKVTPIDTLANATIDGAGLKLKYGFVDFANLTPIPEMNLTVGLQKVYFGTIYDWTYSLIGKAPTDEYKVVNSSDYGVTVNGYLPQGFGEYAIGAYNGEGYKKVGASLSDNISPAYLMNLRLTPITGVTVGGSYMSNTVGREKALKGDVLNKKYEEQALLDGILRLAYGPADLWVEYISKDVKYKNDSAKDYKATGMMIMPTLSLAKFLPLNIQLIGRLDTWDESDRPETDLARSLLNATTFGINYNFLLDESANPGMQLQLNYTDKKYDEDKSNAAFADGMKDSSQIMLQLKWKFSSIIPS